MNVRQFSKARSCEVVSCVLQPLTVCCIWISLQFARPQSLIGYGSRCDKLDQAETRSLLMCFLHIMKTISEGRWRWQRSPLYLLLSPPGEMMHFHQKKDNGWLTLPCECCNVQDYSSREPDVLVLGWSSFSGSSVVLSLSPTSVVRPWLSVLCFLFPDVLVSYWHRAIHQEISDFFNILE